MDDRDLEKTVQLLGSRASAQLDVDKTARAVVERLRVEGRRPSWWQRPQVLLRVAAAFAVVVTAGVIGRQLALGGGAGQIDIASESTPFRLDALSSDDLVEVLDSLSLAAPPSETRPAGLHDLTESQLQELLRRMEAD